MNCIYYTVLYAKVTSNDEGGYHDMCVKYEPYEHVLTSTKEATTCKYYKEE